MADNNNVFILFEEIREMLIGMKSGLEELSRMTDRQQQTGASRPDLSFVRVAVAERAKAQSEEIKGLLAKQWEAYAQLSTLILQRLDAIRKSQDGQDIQHEQPPQEHIHRHCFDIKSSKVFSFVAGLGIVCIVSLCGNIKLWQSKRQYSDDALKFRAIRAWGGCDANDVLWLNQVFDIRRDGKAIEWVQKQADGYDTSLKAVSDSLMQERLKNETKPQ